MNLIDLIDHLPALPEVLLLVGASVLMIADVRSKHPRRSVSYWIAQATLILAFAATLFIVFGSGGGKFYLFNGLFVSDLMSQLLKLVCYMAVSAALVYSRQWLIDRGMLRGEFMTLLLFSLLGMM